MTLNIRPATLEDWKDIDLLVNEAYLRDNPQGLQAPKGTLDCENDSPHVMRCVVRTPSGELAAAWALELIYTPTDLYSYLGGHVTWTPVFPILVGGRAAAAVTETAKHSGAFNALLDISFKLLVDLRNALGQPVSALNVHYKGNSVVKKLVRLGYQEHDITRTKGVWDGDQVTTYADPEDVTKALLPRLQASNQVPAYVWDHPVALAELVLIQNPSPTATTMVPQGNT